MCNILLLRIVKTRSGCWKVMFVDASVRDSVYLLGCRYHWLHVLSRGLVYLVPCPFWEVDLRRGWVLSGEYSVVCTWCECYRRVPGVGVHPLLLTSSGSHQNMYHWQAGGTHPSGMISFCKYSPIAAAQLLINIDFNIDYKLCVTQTYSNYLWGLTHKFCWLLLGWRIDICI